MLCLLIFHVEQRETKRKILDPGIPEVFLDQSINVFEQDAPGKPNWVRPWDEVCWESREQSMVRVTHCSWKSNYLCWLWVMWQPVEPPDREWHHHHPNVPFPSPGRCDPCSDPSWTLPQGLSVLSLSSTKFRACSWFSPFPSFAPAQGGAGSPHTHRDTSPLLPRALAALLCPSLGQSQTSARMGGELTEGSPGKGFGGAGGWELGMTHP